MFVRQCGVEACETQERRHTADLEFHEDGTISRESHINPDGSKWSIKYEHQYRSGHLTAVRHVREDSVTVCTDEYDGLGRLSRIVDHSAGAGRVRERYEYDDACLRKRTQFVDVATQPPDMLHLWHVEGTDGSYSAPETAKVTTLYSQHDRPIELLFHNASDQVVSRVMFTYDADGNLIEELQMRAREAFASLLKDVPPDQTDIMHAMFQSVIEPVRITHGYDHNRRRVRTRQQLGLLSDQVRTRSYNEYGEEITEISEEHSRDYAPDNEGQLLPVPATEEVTRSESRFHYEYDERGNWTKKTVAGRSSIDQEFSISSVEERTIRYFHSLS
jgi:hypothetical protein